MITIRHRGNFNSTSRFLKHASKAEILSILHKYGAQGVDALSAATPTESGETARGWSYSIDGGRGSYSIIWSNSHINKGVNIALILQTGHGTRNGGYVSGRDYINPALRPVFEAMADSAWKEVTGG